MPSQRSHFGTGTNARAAAVSRLGARGVSLFDLTEANPTQAGIVYPAEPILEAFAARDMLRYEPEALGLYTARVAVCELYAARGLALEPANVLLTASTSEAYAFLFKLLCDPGDAVLVPRPSYPLLEQLARLENVELRTYPLEYDGAWHIDTDAVRAKLSDRTRAIVLVSPNNPTGSFVKKPELAALGALGLPIISDEVFGEYAFRADRRRACSALEARGATVFALGGLSKFAGLPQMKLAWCALSAPEPARAEYRARLEHIADTFLSAGTPVQLALPALLQQSAPVQDQIRARLRHNRACLQQALQTSAVTLLDAEGGWYAVLRLPALMAEEDWVLTLLEQQHVLVEPGYFYDFFSEPFVVVSLLTTTATFSEGIRRLVAHVAEAAR
ncbi:MAG TPA: pyridoxal phosphate-dependent aminotransferase [Polyangiaceae bacterium]